MGISSRLSQVALLAQARGFEAQIVACGLKLLDEVGGPGDQGAPALLGQGQTERSRPMGFAPTWPPEAQEIGPPFRSRRRRRRAPGPLYGFFLASKSMVGLCRSRFQCHEFACNSLVAKKRASKFRLETSANHPTLNEDRNAEGDDWDAEVGESGL